MSDVPLQDTSMTLDPNPEREELQRQFALLYRAALAFNSTRQVDEVLAAVMDEVGELLDAGSWAVWFVEPNTGDAILAQGHLPGLDQELANHRLSPGEGIAGWCIATGRSANLEDVMQDARFSHELVRRMSIAVHSLLVAPLRTRNGVVGAIAIGHPECGHYTAGDQALFEALAASAAITLENARFCERAQREIGERERTEQALRASETRYRTLVETSPDAIVLTNLQGRITLCNQQALSLLRCERRSRVLGHHYLELFPGTVRNQAVQYYQQVIRGTPLHHIEFPLRRVDGSVIDVEWSASLVVDGLGNPSGVVGFARDITDRRRAEAAIRRHNAELRILNTIATHTSQSHTLDHMLATALDETLAAFSAESGWVSVTLRPNSTARRDERTIEIRRGLLDEPHDRAKAAAFIAERTAAVDKERAPQLLLDSDLCGLCTDLTEACDIACLPILVHEDVVGALGIIARGQSAAPFLDGHNPALLAAIGRQIGVAVENAHLSEEVAEIQMLREINQMRAELIANFSHELRTPLGIIEMAATTLLRTDFAPDAPMRIELLQDIDNQVTHLGHMIQDILDTGRLEEGRLTLQTAEFDLAELTHSVVRSLGTGLNHHALQVEMPEEPLRVLADPGRIRQVLHNLVDNAVKYTPEGGRITIRGRRLGHKARLDVQDPGIGIPTDQIPLIFQRFYRVQNAATRHINGAGLGLTTVKALVEAHGGEIWVESTPGHGSTFSFTLPSPPSNPERM